MLYMKTNTMLYVRYTSIKILAGKKIKANSEKSFPLTTLLSHTTYHAFNTVNDKPDSLLILKWTSHLSLLSSIEDATAFLSI